MQGLADQLFADTCDFIAQSRAPDVRVQMREMAPSLVRGLLGGRRRFLVVTNTGNSNLRPYRYGNNRDVAWYVVFRVSLWRRLLAYLVLVSGLDPAFLPFVLLFRTARARREGLLDLDLFDQQGLRACITNAHHCLLKAVEKVMLSLNQGPIEDIERKSRGFLGIS